MYFYRTLLLLVGLLQAGALLRPLLPHFGGHHPCHQADFLSHFQLLTFNFQLSTFDHPRHQGTIAVSHFQLPRHTCSCSWLLSFNHPPPFCLLHAVNYQFSNCQLPPSTPTLLTLTIYVSVLISAGKSFVHTPLVCVPAIHPSIPTIANSWFLLNHYAVIFMCHRDLVGGCNNFQIDRGLVTKYDLLAKHCWKKSVHEWELVDYLLVDTM